jgi:hypothetical protein
VKQVGFEFHKSVKENPSVIVFRQGDIDCGMADDLDGRRNQRIDGQTRRANQKGRDGLIGKTHQEKLQIKRIFLDSPA